MGSEFTLMTFNIRYATASDGEFSWPYRRNAVMSMLGRTKPDVLCLQEALRSQIDEIRHAFPDYEEAGLGRDDGISAGEHCQTLVAKGRFRLEDWQTFWLSDTPSVVGSRSWGNTLTRICTRTTLHDLIEQRTLTVFNVHLDHECKAAMVRGAELVGERAYDVGPVVVAGDFNALPTAPPLAALTGHGPRLTNAFLTLHPRSGSHATFHGFRRGLKGHMIDHVLVSSELVPLKATIMNRTRPMLSDHYPLWCCLRYQVQYP